MSTFYGGPQLVSVGQISFYKSQFGFSQGSYTIPVGHFAIVSFLTRVTGTGVEATVNIGNILQTSGELSGLVVTAGTVLYAYANVGLNNGTAGVLLSYQVFKNP
jgi:hypothetical protein